MKKRIFKNMVLLVGVTLLITFGSLFVICYQIVYEQMQNQIHSEAIYVENAINELSNEDDVLAYLNDLKKESKSRITYVSNDGTVLFDTVMESSTMENHGKRPEIADALANGYTFDVRLSDTISKQTYYYAVRLDSGCVVRIAYTSDSAIALFFNILPYICCVYIVVIIIMVSWVSSMTSKIVNPINNLDLKEPADDFEYKELIPLLARIRKQNEEQQRNEQIRREFTANVSHELKTPLTSISGYAEMIETGMVMEGDEKKFAGIIHKESLRLMNLVEDTIRLSKLDEKKIAIEKEDVNLLKVVEDVKNSIIPLANKNKVTFVSECGEVHIDAVELMMNELILNLCNNAVKYNRPNGQVTLRIFKEDEKVVIQVIDTGIGISKDNQDRIFERFYRVDKSHSRQTGGTGLGLAIVKHVVEYHNGDIAIDSELDKGTKITVTLV